MKKERLKRQLAIFKSKIKKIYETTLCIVGLGGNGSAFSLIAAYAGFSKFYLIDFDILEISNLNRFLTGSYKDVGKPKVKIVKKRIQSIDPSIQCITIKGDIKEKRGMKAVSDADIIISTVDNDETRIFLQKMCIKQKKPLLDLGSGGVTRDGKLQMLGSRVSFYVPGGACLFCQTLEESPMAQSRISFITPNLIAASIGLEILLSWLTGYGNKVNCAIYDSINHELMTMNITGRENCQYCGK